MPARAGLAETKRQKPQGGTLRWGFRQARRTHSVLSGRRRLPISKTRFLARLTPPNTNTGKGGTKRDKKQRLLMKKERAPARGPFPEIVENFLLTRFRREAVGTPT